MCSLISKVSLRVSVPYSIYMFSELSPDNCLNKHGKCYVGEFPWEFLWEGLWANP